jgi:phage shock protein A
VTWPLAFLTSGRGLQEPDRHAPVNLHQAKASTPDIPGEGAWFSLSLSALCIHRERPMLESSLNQLEQLVNDLVQKNTQLGEQNERLARELAQTKEENDSLQLNLMELEEKNGATAARIQALVDRASAGAVSA